MTLPVLAGLDATSMAPRVSGGVRTCARWVVAANLPGEAGAECASKPGRGSQCWDRASKDKHPTRRGLDQPQRHRLPRWPRSNKPCMKLMDTY